MKYIIPFNNPCNNKNKIDYYSMFIIRFVGQMPNYQPSQKQLGEP